MLHPTQVRSPRALSAALREDHRELERTFTRLLAKFRGGDDDEMRTCWAHLEADLSAHLAAEEHVILPRFEKEHPEAAARILREHADIRAALESLGVDLDLHALRAETAERFIDRLRQHAEYEDQVFYAWADASLSEGELQSVLSRLHALLHPPPSTKRASKT